jgi:outer membrane autotransporter protein
MRKTLIFALGCVPLMAQADNGSGAFSGSLINICSSASPGTALYTRCQELNNSGNLANVGLVSNGQGLEQLPGQGRANAIPQSETGGYRETLNEAWSVFVSADLGQLTRDESTNEAAFDGAVNRFTVGLNYQASSKFLLGIALNHGRDKLDFDNSSGYSNATTTGILLNANFSPNEHLNFDGYLGTFKGSSDNLREVNYQFSTGSGNIAINSLASSSSDIHRQVAGASGAWQWHRSAWSGNVQLGVDHAKTRLDGFTESGGSGFGLRVPKREIVSQTGYLGLDLSKTYSTNWGVIVPNVRMNLRKEFKNPRRTLSVILDQDKTETPIRFDTSDPDTQWGEIGIGVSLVMSKGHQAFFEYRQRFNHSFLQERTLALGWRKEF